MTWPRWLYRLDSPNDRWLALDKLEHLAWGFGVSLVVTLLVGDLRAGWWAVNVGGIGVEYVEYVRWAKWMRTNKPRPWLCDQISLKDLVVNNVGALLTTLLAMLVRAFG